MNSCSKNAKFDRIMGMKAFTFSLNLEDYILFGVDGSFKLIIRLYLFQSPISDILLIDDHRIITSP